MPVAVTMMSMRRRAGAESGVVVHKIWRTGLLELNKHTLHEGYGLLRGHVTTALIAYAQDFSLVPYSVISESIPPHPGDSP